MKWRYKVIPKEKVTEIVNQSLPCLKVELTKGSNSAYHLMLYKGNNQFVTLGRVSKRIFEWFDLVPMDKQSGFINVFDYKFKKPEPVPEHMKKFYGEF